MHPARQGGNRSVTHPAALLLLYLILPLWILAGTADWMCHRREHIECNAGVKESVLHLLMFVEIAVPLLACLLLEINALVFALMLACLVLHEATSLWDVSYASSRRRIPPLEQHVHSFLELLPLAAGLLVAVLHWPQALALFGAGPEPARWNLAWKDPPMPTVYLVAVISCGALLAGLPFVEELWRGLRARQARAKPAAPGP